MLECLDGVSKKGKVDFFRGGTEDFLKVTQHLIFGGNSLSVKGKIYIFFGGGGGVR